MIFRDDSSQSVILLVQTDKYQLAKVSGCWKVIQMGMFICPKWRQTLPLSLSI